MANKKFPDFALVETPDTGSFIVGYKADGSEEQKFTIDSIPISAAIQEALNDKMDILDDVPITRGGIASLQLGLNHATTPTAQTIKAHDVTTGVGAALNLKGGQGSAGSGPVNIQTNLGLPFMTFDQANLNASFCNMVMISDIADMLAIGGLVSGGNGPYCTLCILNAMGEWRMISDHDFNYVL